MLKIFWFPSSLSGFSSTTSNFGQHLAHSLLLHIVMWINLNWKFCKNRRTYSTRTTLDSSPRSTEKERTWGFTRLENIFRFNFSLNCFCPTHPVSTMTYNERPREWMVVNGKEVRTRENVWEKRQDRPGETLYLESWTAIIQLNHEVAFQFNLIFKELLYPIIGLLVVLLLLLFSLLWQANGCEFFISDFFFAVLPHSLSSSYTTACCCSLHANKFQHLFDFSEGLLTGLINSIISLARHAWVIYCQLITMFVDSTINHAKWVIKAAILSFIDRTVRCLKESDTLWVWESFDDVRLFWYQRRRKLLSCIITCLHKNSTSILSACTLELRTNRKRIISFMRDFVFCLFSSPCSSLIVVSHVVNVFIWFHNFSIFSQKQLSWDESCALQTTLLVSPLLNCSLIFSRAQFHRFFSFVCVGTLLWFSKGKHNWRSKKKTEICEKFIFLVLSLVANKCRRLLADIEWKKGRANCKCWTMHWSKYRYKINILFFPLDVLEHDVDVLDFFFIIGHSSVASYFLRLSRVVVCQCWVQPMSNVIRRQVFFFFERTTMSWIFGKKSFRSHDWEKWMFVFLYFLFFVSNLFRL